MTDYDLWVTARCAEEELGLPQWPDPDGVWGRDHGAIEKFREQRSQEPEPHGAQIDGTHPRVLYKLRIGRHRGATWYDRAARAVFFVAFGSHEQGSREDFYAVLLRRLAAVYPTAEDYDELEIWRADRWVRGLREIAPSAIAATEEAQRGDEGVPQEFELERCRVILVAHRRYGDFLYMVRIEPQPGGRLDVRTAAMVATVLASAAGRERTARSPDFNGAALPQGAFAFIF